MRQAAIMAKPKSRTTVDELAQLRNIGKAMRHDFELLGIHTIAQLAECNADELYTRIQTLTRTRHDPCVWDTYAAAIHQARTGQALPWWEFTKIRKAKQNQSLNMPRDVARVFAGYPPAVRSKLLAIRKLIFDTARTTVGVGRIEETLKWQQPSYLTSETNSGSLVRIDQVKNQPGKVGVYFHCQTTLVEEFRALFAECFEFEANRALLLDVNKAIPKLPLRECVAKAMTYRLRKKSVAN